MVGIGLALDTSDEEQKYPTKERKIAGCTVKEGVDDDSVCWWTTVAGWLQRSDAFLTTAVTTTQEGEKRKEEKLANRNRIVSVDVTDDIPYVTRWHDQRLERGTKILFRQTNTQVISKVI